MRRTALLIASIAFVVLLASGVALAVTKVGGPGDDTLRGTDERDRLEGRGGDNTLHGKDETDFLDGGSGNDVLYGMGGNDGYYIWGDGIVGGLLGGFGSDVIYGGDGGDWLAGGEVLIGSFSHPPTDPGSDTLYGGSGDDEMDGQPGADVLYGNGGDDDLYSGGHSY